MGSASWLPIRRGGWWPDIPLIAGDVEGGLGRDNRRLRKNEGKEIRIAADIV
jgi:hypothetical protein